jgi:hypothetical protein
VDARHRQLAGTGIREAVDGPRRRDDDVAGGRGHRRAVELEKGLAGVEDEDLGVGVTVGLRAITRPIVDQEQRDRDVPVVMAAEDIGAVCPRQRSVGDEGHT